MKICEMSRLKEPFPENDLEWRLQSCGERDGKFWGRPLAYITSRAVQERLDEVCGPDGWQCSIKREGDAYLCTLSIRVEHEDGSVEWISRTDGSDSSDIEAVKGGISGAIKRSAVLFGIGRYLYNLKNSWAEISPTGKYQGQTKDRKSFKWNPPRLPDWALPKNIGSSYAAQQNVPQNQNRNDEAMKLKTVLLDWINANALSGEGLKKAEFYIANNDIAGMTRTIEWCKNNARTA